MELEIGIVCGRCESFAAFGAASCVSCANPLLLATEDAAESSPAPPTTREPPRPKSGSAALLLASTPPSATPSSVPQLGTRDPSSGRPGSRVETMDAIPVPTNGALTPTSARAALNTPQKSSTKPKTLEELMDQAKNFVCRSCSSPVPLGHKFCGRCGAAVPPEILTSRTQFFGQLQSPGKAKLILIRGEGVEGLSYQLNADQHVVGKAGQLVFPDDPFVSPKHANFFYKNGNLCVRDEGSLNGVYIRVRGSIPLAPGDQFLAGEQVFRVDSPPTLNDTPGPDGTYFYSSPKHQSPFRISQLLQGGAFGMTVCARSSSLQIGREGGDLNFPTDLYMSGSHCKIDESGGMLTLTDLASRNGTYVRLKDERELGHGDYLFIGRKLLRVEITAA